MHLNAHSPRSDQAICLSRTTFHTLLLQYYRLNDLREIDDDAECGMCWFYTAIQSEFCCCGMFTGPKNPCITTSHAKSRSTITISRITSYTTSDLPLFLGFLYLTALDYTPALNKTRKYVSFWASVCNCEKKALPKPR
jgi:hypothetical protein